MKTLIAAALLACTPALAGDLKADLNAQMAKWVSDFNAHQPSALAAHYSDDVQYIYTFSGQEGASKKALEAFYAQAFKGTPDIAVKLVSYDIVRVSDGVAWGMGTFEDSFTGPDGKKITAPTHASEVWVKQGGQWRIRVDHASFVPPPQKPPADAKAGAGAK